MTTVGAGPEAHAAVLDRVVPYLAVRALITGITGFVGSHLAEFALARGVEVAGSVRAASRSDNIEHLREQLMLVEADLRDPLSVHALLARTRPDWVVHLAGQGSVAASWHAPVETFTRWRPRIHLEQTLTDPLDYWRRRLTSPRV